MFIHNSARNSGYAVAAFVLSLLFAMSFPLNVVALILAVAALVSIKKNPDLIGKGFAITALVFSIIGIVVCFALIGFIVYCGVTVGWEEVTRAFEAYDFATNAALEELFTRLLG